jgi:hypothetical protein
MKGKKADGVVFVCVAWHEIGSMIKQIKQKRHFR